MAGVEYQVFELVRLVNEDMVYAHLLEIDDRIPLVVHLVTDGFEFGGQVLLTLDKTFEHGP